MARLVQGVGGGAGTVAEGRLERTVVGSAGPIGCVTEALCVCAISAPIGRCGEGEGGGGRGGVGSRRGMWEWWVFTGGGGAEEGGCGGWGGGGWVEWGGWGAWWMRVVGGGVGDECRTHKWGDGEGVGRVEVGVRARDFTCAGRCATGDGGWWSGSGCQGLGVGVASISGGGVGGGVLGGAEGEAGGRGGGEGRRGGGAGRPKRIGAGDGAGACGG